MTNTKPKGDKHIMVNWEESIARGYETMNTGGGSGNDTNSLNRDKPLDKKDFDNKFKFVGFFHSTLKELYGKEIADMVMKKVNEKMRITNTRS